MARHISKAKQQQELKTERSLKANRISPTRPQPEDPAETKLGALEFPLEITKAFETLRRKLIDWEKELAIASSELDTLADGENLSSLIDDLESFISRKRTVAPQPSRSVEDRWAEVDLYAAKNPGEPVSALGKELFFELSGLTSIDKPQLDETLLPQKAPALWAEDRRPRETPPDFIKRIYEQWIGKGLGRPDLHRLDKPLYLAFAKWIERKGLPEDLDLPTASERTDRWVKKIAADHGDPMAFADDTKREAERLRSAVRRRQKRGDLSK
jgi:hypothetical protein